MENKILSEYSHPTNGHVRLVGIEKLKKFPKRIEISSDGMTWGRINTRSLTNKGVSVIYFRMIRALLKGTKISKFNSIKLLNPIQLSL